MTGKIFETLGINLFQELQERHAKEIEDAAELRARARSGPKYTPEGVKQGRYEFEKLKALKDVKNEFESRHNEELSALVKRLSERENDPATLAKPHKENNLSGMSHGASYLTKSFNSEAQRGPSMNFNHMARAVDKSAADVAATQEIQQDGYEAAQAAALSRMLNRGVSNTDKGSGVDRSNKSQDTGNEPD